MCIRDSFPHRFEEAFFCVTISGGIASYPDFVSPADMMEAADRALIKAKESGRDKIVVESARSHIEVGFWDYARFGIPVTILTTVIGMILLLLLHSSSYCS